MIDKLGWYLEPGEFKIQTNDLTKRANFYEWKTFASLAYLGKYFPTIRLKGPCLQIVTCPAKALYNHNARNISAEDLETFLTITNQQLLNHGIEVSKETLRTKRLSTLHVNQLVKVPLTIDTCSRMLRTAEKTGKFKQGISLYPEEGICIFNNLKHRKLKIYDKTMELLKQPSAKEIVQELQQTSTTLLQVEYQIQGAREIEREYAYQGIKLENTLENAFNPEIARKILYSRAKEALQHIYVVNSSEYDLLENTEIMCKQKNIHGLQAISSLVGCLWICKQFGINSLLRYLEHWTDHKTAYRYCKKIKNLFSTYSQARDKDILQDAILTAIQNIGEESSPIWQRNTTGQYLLEMGNNKEPNLC